MLNGFPDNFRMDDDDEVINEFRRKQANFDLEEKQNEINNSRSLFIGALAGLAMAAVVGWFVLAPRYQSNETEDLPIIRRPQEDVKVQPVDPGSVAIPSREQTVYDIIERRPESIEEAKVLPPAEQPNADAIEALVEEVSARKEPAEPAAKPAAESLVGNIPAASSAKTEKTEENQPAAEPQPAVSENGSKPRAATEPVAETVKEKPVEATSAAAPKEPARSQTEAKPATEPTAKPQAAAKAPAKAAAPVAKGSWQIQLMSSPNRQAVEKSWASLSAKYKMLSGLAHEISSADLGSKGTYYRLKAGNFATREEAAAFCNRVKAAGGSCFVARK